MFVVVFLLSAVIVEIPSLMSPSFTIPPLFSPLGSQLFGTVSIQKSQISFGKSLLNSSRNTLRSLPTAIQNKSFSGDFKSIFSFVALLFHLSSGGVSSFNGAILGVEKEKITGASQALQQRLKVPVSPFNILV